ncbi:MAG: glycosyltransferase, partial [Verrucomicrobiales bacterium]
MDIPSPNPFPLPKTSSLVSVVIPARNAASTVARLLRSLAPDREVIREILLVDDGSVDATAEVASDISERHNLPLRVLPVSFGSAGKSRNFGIAQARGRYLLLIDADDEIFPRSLSLLSSMLLDAPGAGLAIGACIRRTANRPDKIKIPHSYTEDRTLNVIRYLANELWPIAMGSAMLVTSEAAEFRFPETIGLDEDTCFWTALLTKVGVVTTPEPVLLYRLDEARMAHRYTASPRVTLLGISRELRKLGRHGIPGSALKRRSAWVALRISRQLIMERRYREAADILRFARNHPEYRSGWKMLQYTFRSHMGTLVEAFRGSPSTLTHCRQSDKGSGASRIMVLTVDPAAPPVSGADIRNFQNALSASKQGACCLVSVRPGDPSADIPGYGIEVRTAGLAGEISRSLTSRRCRVEARIPRSVLPRLLAIISEFKPDIILVEGIPLASLLVFLRPHAEMLILDMHNIESDLAARRPVQTSLSKRLSAILKNEPARTRKLEKKAIGLVDRIWVCSELDRQRLMELHRPASTIHVVPNG